MVNIDKLLMMPLDEMNQQKQYWINFWLQFRPTAGRIVKMNHKEGLEIKEMQTFPISVLG